MSAAPVEVRRVAVLLFSAALRQPQTRQFLDALRQHSPHEFILCNVAGVVPDLPDADDFDAVLVHGSVPLGNVSARLDQLHSWLAAFPGQTIAFVNNEFQGDMSPREWIEAAGVDQIYSTLDGSSIDRVYQELPERVSVETVLPVYSNEELETVQPLPHERRPQDLVFKEVEPAIKHGTTQTLAKLVERMSELSSAPDLMLDVSWGSEEEVLSSRRLSFVAEGRATFMIEQSFLVPGDDVMDDSARRLPPGFFEAAACRTGLVLVEGAWSGLVEPMEHYFPLRSDLSNLDEAMAWLSNADEVEAMSHRAHEHLIASGEFSVLKLVARIDQALESVGIVRHNRSACWTGPAVVDLMSDQWLQERNMLSLLRERERQAEILADDARTLLAAKERDTSKPSGQDEKLCGEPDEPLSAEKKRREHAAHQLSIERRRRQDITSLLEEERRHRRELSDRLLRERARREEMQAVSEEDRTRRRDLLQTERQRRQDVASLLDDERRHRRDLTDRLLHERARRDEIRAVGAEERDRRLELLSKLEVAREVRTELVARLENEKDRRAELLARLSEERERRLEYAEQMRDRLQKEHNLRLEFRTKMLSERDRRLQTDEKIDALRNDLARRDDRISDLVDQLREAWRNEEGG